MSFIFTQPIKCRNVTRIKLGFRVTLCARGLHARLAMKKRKNNLETIKYCTMHTWFPHESPSKFTS